MHPTEPKTLWPALGSINSGPPVPRPGRNPTKLVGFFAAFASFCKLFDQGEIPLTHLPRLDHKVVGQNRTISHENTISFRSNHSEPATCNDQNGTIVRFS